MIRMIERLLSRNARTIPERKSFATWSFFDGLVIIDPP